MWGFIRMSQATFFLINFGVCGEVISRVRFLADPISGGRAEDCSSLSRWFKSGPETHWEVYSSQTFFIRMFDSFFTAKTNVIYLKKLANKRTDAREVKGAVLSTAGFGRVGSNPTPFKYPFTISCDCNHIDWVNYLTIYTFCELAHIYAYIRNYCCQNDLQYRNTNNHIVQF